jgi:hypothetical protein
MSSQLNHDTLNGKTAAQHIADNSGLSILKIFFLPASHIHPPMKNIALTSSTFYSLMPLRFTATKSVSTDDSPTVGAFKARYSLCVQQSI